MYVSVGLDTIVNYHDEWMAECLAAEEEMAAEQAAAAKQAIAALEAAAAHYAEAGGGELLLEEALASYLEGRRPLHVVLWFVSGSCEVLMRCSELLFSAFLETEGVSPFMEDDDQS